MKNWLKFGMVLLGAIAAEIVPAATDVMFFIDAEDYTCDSSTDALRDLAKVFNAESVRVEVNVVGYLARHLRQQGRNDVFRELRSHRIGSHTLYLAKRPTVEEYTDIADAAQAYRLAMAEESLSLGLIRTAFGLRNIELYAPVGADSYAAMYAAADAGMKFCVGADFATSQSCFWYCGLLQLPILDPATFQFAELMTLAAEPDYPAILDRLSSRKFAGLRVETSWIANLKTWKDLNFDARHPVAFGEWKKNRQRPAKDVQRFYSRLRRLLAALKADSRFRLVSLDDFADQIAERRPVRRSDVARIRSRLTEKFGPVDDLELSLADIYQASVDFLRGEDKFVPGQVRGFLQPPEGVSAPVTVTALSLKAAADRLVDVDYIPASIEVETVEGAKRRIGPADFVLAALEILETNAGKVTIAPRDQLGSLPFVWPATAKDKFLAQRLRLQAWTFRNIQP